MSGGFKEGRFSNQLLAYSPRHDTWHERAPMNVPRGWHTMISFGEVKIIQDLIILLIIFFRIFSLPVEMLDSTSELISTKLKSTPSCRINGQWYPRFLFHNPRVVSASITTSTQNSYFQNLNFPRIVIIGGYSWTHQKCVNTIQAYDPATDTWERPGNLPIELSGVKAAVLSIPYSLSSGGKKPSPVFLP